jgi:hypothetical protein
VDPAALDRRVEAISAPPPIAADEGLAETEPSAEAEPEAKAAEDSPEPEHPGPEPVATIEVDPIPCASELADDTLPGFARMGRTSRMWRIPLVSSFLVAGSLVVLRLW